MKVIDMHCDTIAGLYKEKRKSPEKDFSLCSLPSFSVDLQKMKKASYLLQNFAVFIDRAETPDPMKTALDMISLYYEELEKNSGLIAPVRSYQDIEDNRKAGLMSAMLTLEEGAVLKGSIENLRTFYEKGVRMIALTWNYPNEIGNPNLTLGPDGSPLFTMRSPEGFTGAGIGIIQEMERLGMIIDVSHLSDGGFWDIIKYTKAPFAASHSNAAAQCNVCRNLTDEMIRALAERGGVAGLNFCTDFLRASDHPASFLPDPSSGSYLPAPSDRPSAGRISRIDDMVRHVRHMTNTGGIEVCGLGSDFDGISNDVEFGDASGMEQLYEALKKNGFSSEEADKIFYKNVLRLYKDVLKSGI